jgi:hypothetical protein
MHYYFYYNSIYYFSYYALLNFLIYCALLFFLLYNIIEDTTYYYQRAFAHKSRTCDTENVKLFDCQADHNIARADVHLDMQEGVQYVHKATFSAVFTVFKTEYYTH